MSLTTNSTTSTPQPSPLEPTPLDCALLNGAEPGMPKPADLAVLGLRPHDYFTVTRSLQPDGSGRAKRSPWASGRAPDRVSRSRFQQNATTTSARRFVGLLGCARMERVVTVEF